MSYVDENWQNIDIVLSLSLQETLKIVAKFHLIFNSVFVWETPHHETDPDSKLRRINVCTSSSVWFIREISSFQQENSLWIWLTLWQLTDPETIATHNACNQQPWIPSLWSNSFLSNSISTLTIKVSNFCEGILGNGIFSQSSSPFSQCACEFINVYWIIMIGMFRSFSGVLPAASKSCRF